MCREKPTMSSARMAASLRTTRWLVEPVVPAECTSRENYVFNQTASTGKTFAQNVDIDILR